MSKSTPEPEPEPEHGHDAPTPAPSEPPEAPTPIADPRPTDQIPTIWQSLIDPNTQPTTTLGRYPGDLHHRRSSETVRPRQSTVSRIGDNDPLVELNDYELDWQLGAGGMGVVMSARQTSCDRVVAVKLMQPQEEERRETQRQERFLSEAVVTADLDHPNIPPIYDVGCNQGGDLFYSMKHVHGVPWSRVIEEQDTEENLDILLAVANAVAFAHSRGVLHRDIKPSNVMLGDFGAVYLMDWGLAAAVPDHELDPDSAHRKAIPLTEANAAAGTPAYMAPEMAHGLPEGIGIRTDVYLLGATLFQILTSLVPHPGDTVSDCLIAAAANSISLEPDEDDSELMRIARKAMARRPEDRYPDVPTFCTALRQYQRHAESITLCERADTVFATARERGTYEHFTRAIFSYQDAIDLWRGNDRAREGLLSSRLAYGERALAKGDLELAEDLLSACGNTASERRAAVRRAIHARDRRQRHLRLATRTVVALGVLLLVVISLAYFRVSRAEAETARQRDAALTSERRARSEGDRARTVNAFLQDMLAAPNPLRDGRQVRVIDILDRAADDIEARFATRPRLRAQIHQTLGASFLALGQLDRAETHLTAANRDLEGLGLAQSRIGLANRSSLGGLHLARDRIRRAERMLRRTVAAQERECGPDDPQTLATGRRLVRCLLAAGGLREAEQQLAKLRDRSRGTDAVAADALHGRLLYHLGRRDAAATAYAETLAEARDHHGERHPRILLLQLRHARHLGEAGDYAAATEAFHAVLAALEEALGPEHPTVLRCEMELGRILQRMGHAEEAAERLDGLLQIQESILGYEHADTVCSRAWLGLAWAASGRKRQGVALLREAVRGQVERHGSDHPATLRYRAMLGRAVIHSGRVAEGLQLLEDAVVRATDLLGADHADVLEATLWLGRARQMADDQTGAEELLRATAERLATRKGPDHPHRILCLWFLSDPLWKQGRLGEAVGTLARAHTLAERRYDSANIWPRNQIRERLDEFLAEVRPLRRVHCDDLGSDGRPPRIDGHADDPCWNRPHPLRAYEAFDLLAESDYTPPPHEPVAILIADAEHLYVTVRCPDDGDRLPCQATAHDGPVGADDAVELRWRRPGEKRPLRLLINRAGIVRDAFGDDPAHAIPDLRVATAVAGDGWQLECALPWTALGFPRRPPDGTTLPFDLIRILPGDPPRRYRWQQLDPTRDPDRQYGKLVVGPKE